MTESGSLIGSFLQAARRMVASLPPLPAKPRAPYKDRQRVHIVSRPATHLHQYRSGWRWLVIPEGKRKRRDINLEWRLRREMRMARR